MIHTLTSNQKEARSIRHLIISNLILFTVTINHLTPPKGRSWFAFCSSAPTTRLRTWGDQTMDHLDRTLHPAHPLTLFSPVHHGRSYVASRRHGCTHLSVCPSADIKRVLTGLSAPGPGPRLRRAVSVAGGTHLHGCLGPRRASERGG